MGDAWSIYQCGIITKPNNNIYIGIKNIYTMINSKTIVKKL